VYLVAPRPSVGFVLDAKVQLAVVGFSVVWTLFGTPSALGVMLAIDQYQSMRYTIQHSWPNILQLHKIINIGLSFCKFAVHENHAYHRPCYKECFHPKCDVCSSFVSTLHFDLINELENLVVNNPDYPLGYSYCWWNFGNQIPTNKNGLIEYRAHPFWMQKYCPSHENDGTPRCCSCERMEVSVMNL